MEALHIILIFLHFAAIGVGGAANFGIPAVGATIAKAAPEHRAAIAAVVPKLIILGHGALATLIVTGVIMAWCAEAWTVGTWFWLKMVFVLWLVVGIAVGARNGRKALAGDAEAMALAPKLAVMNNLAFLAIVFAAVMAFN